MGGNLPMKLSIFVTVVAFGVTGAILFVPAADLRAVVLVCTGVALAVTNRIHGIAERSRSEPLHDTGRECVPEPDVSLLPGTYRIRRWENGLGLFDFDGVRVATLVPDTATTQWLIHERTGARLRFGNVNRLQMLLQRDGATVARIDVIGTYIHAGPLYHIRDAGGERVISWTRQGGLTGTHLAIIEDGVEAFSLQVQRRPVVQVRDPVPWWLPLVLCVKTAKVSVIARPDDVSAIP
jgi:hypothetical protein